MLRWRLLVGGVLIGLLAGLVWLDHHARWPGVWLFPLGVLLLVLGTDELLELLAACGVRPVRLIVQLGNLLAMSTTWVALLLLLEPAASRGATSSLALGRPGQQIAAAAVEPGTLLWPLAGWLVALGLVFLVEVLRFHEPPGACANLAGGVFATVYLGLMFALLVHLRMAWGIGAVLSVVAVVKLGDIGAYAVGRLIGRHKLIPRLSPGKTWEGLAGQLVFNALGAWITFAWLVPSTTIGATLPIAWWRWGLFALVVGLAGLLGDLAESLLKRSAGRKDSSTWLPGLGGILDVLDSLLVATPAAWLCWASGLLGTAPPGV